MAKTDEAASRRARGRQSPRYLADFFDEIAADYDEWEEGLHRRLALQLADLADPQPGDRCLDIGTGTGLVARIVADRVGRKGFVACIDTSERMLAVARRDVPPQMRVFTLDVDDVFFRAGSFNLVTIGRSISFLAEPERVLAEARRCLGRDGRLAILCRRRSLSTVAERLFLRSLAELADRHPIHLPSVPEGSGLGEPAALQRLLAETGFELVSTRDTVRGGRARDINQWMDVMMRSWPAARMLIGSLGRGTRVAFEDRLDEAMQALGEDAFHYHHAYVFALARTVDR